MTARKDGLFNQTNNDMEPNTKLAKVFSLFLSKNELRENIQNPFEIKGYTYATDAISLVRCQSQHIDFRYTNKLKPPKADLVIPEINTNQLLELNAIDFDAFKTEDDYDITIEENECDACDGLAEVDFEFSHNGKDYDITHECPVCQGEGKIYTEEAKPNGKKTFPVGSAIKIGSCFYRPRQIEKLKTVRNLIEQPIFIVYNDFPNKACRFRCGFLDIVIMPLLESNNPNVLAEL